MVRKKKYLHRFNFNLGSQGTGTATHRWTAMVKPSALLFVFVSSLFLPHTFSQTTVPKKGGIYFRVDDNHPVSQWSEYTAVFDRYGLKCGLAINMTFIVSDASKAQALRQIQSRGHVLMDHTPDHATHYFTGVSNPSYYSGRSGVDHVSGNKVCLSYGSIDSTTRPGSGYADVNKNMVISRQPGEFKDLTWFTQIYFRSLNKLCNVSSASNANTKNVDTLYILSAWDESIDLGVYQNVRYVRGNIFGATITDEAVNLLADRSIQLFAQSGFTRPVSWAQPGSYTPNLDRKQAKRTLGQAYQYQIAATYWDQSLKVSNEYDPLSDKRFSMMWGDFDEENSYARPMETYIADRVAKHYVLAGHSHFANGINGWNGYLSRMDSLLSWCVQSGVQVKAEIEWANILYGSTPDPYENIIPPLNADRDINNRPDGYYSPVDGYVDKTDGIPDNSHYSYATNRTGRICLIQQLGGIEKGDNDFVFWMKGNVGSTVSVTFNMPGHSRITLNYTITTTAWKKYSLSDATSHPASVNIPADVSYLDLDIWSNTFTGATLKISGMEMRKAGLPLPGIPALLQPANNALGQPVNLSLQWLQAPNATTYRVQLATDSLFSVPAVDDSSLVTTSRSVGPLANNRRYFWRVKSKNTSGQSGWSSVWSFQVSDTHLPIQLVSFTVRRVKENVVALNWTTSSEVNNYGFETQKSLLAQGPFQPILYGFVAGHGTTNVPQAYALLDSSSGSGMWYRLRQIDLDGKEHFSDPVLENGLTSVDNRLIPREFSLEQNFPNPFNPSTVIRYVLPKGGSVSLAVYNTLGQLVAQLVDGFRQAGVYEAVFDADRLAGGLYLYRLEAGEYVQTRKLLVVK